MGTIIVGVDGSAGSIAALRWAIGHAARNGGEVVALRAEPTPSLGNPFGNVSADAPPTARPSSAPHLSTNPFGNVGEYTEPSGDTLVRPRNGRASLEQAIAEARRGTDADVVVTAEVVHGYPAAALIERAAGADLVVVGTRGLGAVRELVLGSVSHKVASQAPCPVVVVPRA